MMAKTHPILALLLTLALMLQGHGGAPAHESGCCPDDCSMDAAFCPVPGAGAACAACQAAAISPHALNAAAVTGKEAAMRSSAVKIYSADTHTIWRPPIAA
jgi:hypothetical protein